MNELTSKLRNVRLRASQLNVQTLRKWNLGLAVLHAGQAILVLVLSRSSTLPVTTNYATLDPLASQGAGHPVIGQATRHLFDVNLAYLVAIFFAITAIAHLIIATTYRQRYEANLTKGINKARWLEYGLSASIMLVAIGLLSGIYDFSSLLMIFALSLIMSLLGLVMELHNQTSKKTNWANYLVGCLAGLVPWVVFVVYIIGANKYGQRGIPGFVYGIYASLFILFGSFALNMYLQYKKKGKWSNYLYGERVYMILSLVAKTALAWQIFAGTLR